MKLHVNFYDDFFDNVVANPDTIEWADLVEMFSNFIEAESKDEVPLFNLCEFKTADFEPATRNVRVNGVKTGERVLKLSETGGVQVGRCAENVVAYSALVLDYDGNGATLEKAITRFSEFTHLGYTSYRHAITGVDKFRIIFPFSAPCPVAEWDRRKAAFLEFAGPEIDKSSVATSRAFYIPSHPAEGREYAAAWSMDGVVLDWTVFEAAELREAVPYTGDVCETELTAVLDELKKHVPNSPPYEQRFVLVRAVAKYLGKAEAISQVRSRWPDTNLNGKYEDMVAAPLKANSPGLGSIIYQIRSYNPAYTPNTKPTVYTDRWGHEALSKKLPV